jgi:hypothetical protein
MDTKQNKGKPKLLPTAYSAESNKKVALEDALELQPFEVKPSAEWRSRLSEARQMTAEKLCDVIYAMAMQGATIELIARYWGLKARDIEKVGADVWQMANAELILRLFKDQVESALTSKHPLAKIWAGKQFCSQRDDASIFASADEAAQRMAGNGGLTVTVNIAKADRDETGTTIVKDQSKDEPGEEAAQLH